MQIQWSEYNVFCQAIANVIIASGVFSPSSVDFIVMPDENFKWPLNPAPFCLIEISDWLSEEEGIGGGRYSKTYGQEFKVHCIIDNIYDISFRDTNLVASYSPITGAYTLIDNLINILEQSYPVDSLGDLVLVELPRSQSIDAPKRYKGSNQSNQYSDICINYYVKFCESMPNTNNYDAMPN